VTTNNAPPASHSFPATQLVVDRSLLQLYEQTSSPALQAALCSALYPIQPAKIAPNTLSSQRDMQLEASGSLPNGGVSKQATGSLSVTQAPCIVGSPPPPYKRNVADITPTVAAGTLHQSNQSTQTQLPPTAAWRGDHASKPNYLQQLHPRHITSGARVTRALIRSQASILGQTPNGPRDPHIWASKHPRPALSPAQTIRPQTASPAQLLPTQQTNTG
jgi:hypothetical protein